MLVSCFRGLYTCYYRFLTADLKIVTAWPRIVILLAEYWQNPSLNLIREGSPVLPGDLWSSSVILDVQLPITTITTCSQAADPIGAGKNLVESSMAEKYIHEHAKNPIRPHLLIRFVCNEEEQLSV